jgi:ribosome-binding factor A
MSEKSKRVNRMAELIQSIIAQLLLKEVSDPRLKSVTITNVDLSPDGKRALIYFSLLDPTPQHIKSAEQAFQKAAGFFRVNLSSMTELRHTPQLHFHYDASLMVAEKVTQLINKIE